MTLKLEAPVNQNYCATVVKIQNINKLENCDNIVGTSFFGYQAIIDLKSPIGTLGIVFPPETQLSEEFCRKNNLFRHGNLNEDESIKGYIEDNRRVRAIRFRGNRSDALFMPIKSLSFTGINLEEFKEGMEFDKLNGHDICQKYVVKKNISNKQQSKKKVFNRVDVIHFPEHNDTLHFLKFKDQLNPDTEIIVTQKLHGTSIRIGNTIVQRKLNWLEWLLSKLGVKIQETEYDYVFGSRKVIKDINNPHQNHWYGTDLWTEEGKKLEGAIPELYILYGELIGWSDENTKIQTDYAYSYPPGTRDLFIYRIAIVNPRGVVTDLSWDQIKEFCKNNNLKTVPELFRGKLSELHIDKFLDIRYREEGYSGAVALENNPTLVDEGICVRIEGLHPLIFKLKSPVFLQHETKLLDEGMTDLESSESL